MPLSDIFTQIIDKYEEEISYGSIFKVPVELEPKTYEITVKFRETMLVKYTFPT